MVQIATSVKVVARVGSARGFGTTVFAGWSAVHFVGAANLLAGGVVPCYLISLFGVLAHHFLLREVGPSAYAVLVIDDQVHQDARVVVLVVGDHVTQFILGAPATVVVQPIDGGVTHVLGGAVAVDFS